MKIKYNTSLFIIVTLLVCHFQNRGYAQVKVDTNADAIENKSHDLFQDSIAQHVLNQAKWSAFYLKNHIPARYSRAGVNYQLLRGNFIAAQDANQIQVAQLSTEGSSTLGNVKLFGSLNYTKVYEDSTSFGHQTRNNPSTPYYFGAPAAVHYERTTYAFQTMAGRSFFNEKLDLAIGLDYKVGSHFSTNDPRGSLQEYQFDMHLNLAYQLNQKLKLGLGVGHGYGREAVNIGYKNPRYYESSAYPEFYNHLVNGYREWDDALRNRVYDNKFTRNQVQFGLDWENSSLGKLAFVLKYKSENQAYFLSNNTGFTDLADYNLTTTGLQVNWQKKFNNSLLAAFLYYDNLSGKDENLLFQANNYLYHGNDIKFNLFFQPKHHLNTWTYYLKAHKKDEQRLDGISGNDIAYQKLYTEAGFTFRKSNLQRKTWSFSPALAYQLPLSEKLVLPLAIGSFTQGVILHDYRFNQATFWSPKLDIAYSLPAFKSMLLKLQLENRFIIQLTQQDNPLIIEKLPLQDRLVSKFSLNLYF